MGIWRCILLFFACTGLCAAQFSKPLKRPNIVFMIVDDLGWNDVSFHGSKQIPTPNIDAIARDGIILNQYYVQPTCSPSRGSLMTGKYPIQIGFQHEVIGTADPWGLPLKEKILPQYLKCLGYTTHAVGKWHLGFFQEEYLPLRRGFDSFFGYYSGVEDYYTHFANTGNYSGLDLHDNGKVAPQFNGIYGTELFTSKAKKVIEMHNPAQPLFLYFAQQAPHSGNFDTEPIQVPEKYVKPLLGIKDEKRRKFAGMVSAMDHSVGEIFQALEKSRMLDNTIFVFTTDNGGAAAAQDGTRGSNWPLRGTKYSLWEGGIRGAAVIWSPMLRRKSRIYNGLMHISDWLPTLLSAAGGNDALKMVNEISGVDQWPSLTNILPSPRHEILLNIDDVEGIEGIRKGNYKLIKRSNYDEESDGWYDKNGDPIMNGIVNAELPKEKLMYNMNYIRVLKHSNTPRILWLKYGKDPRLVVNCTTHACKEQLEVKCGGPRPIVDTCKPKEEPCLFDVVKDPCEFYNIAGRLPQVTASLERAIDKYRPLVVPPGGESSDPKADPKLHANTWVPWK